MVMSKAMLVYQRVTSRTSLTLNFNLIFCLCQMPRYSHQTAGAGSPQISHPDPTCLISAAVTRQSKSIQFTTHHVIVAVQIPPPTLDQIILAKFEECSLGKKNMPLHNLQLQATTKIPYRSHLFPIYSLNYVVLNFCVFFKHPNTSVACETAAAHPVSSSCAAAAAAAAAASSWIECSG